MTPKPDSRLPWRVVLHDNGSYEVWTGQMDYVIAHGIGAKGYAELIAKAPELQSQVESLTQAKNSALAILERLKATVALRPDAVECGICEAIEILQLA